MKGVTKGLLDEKVSPGNTMTKAGINVSIGSFRASVSGIGIFIAQILLIKSYIWNTKTGGITSSNRYSITKDQTVPLLYSMALMSSTTLFTSYWKKRRTSPHSNRH